MSLSKPVAGGVGRHAFVIIGAPTKQTVADLIEAFDKHRKGPHIVHRGRPEDVHGTDSE